MSDDERDESRRQVARRERRNAGDRSARLAHQLMSLRPSALEALGLDDDLREAVDRARAVTSPVARRRAERSLAGDLRRADLDEVERRLGAAGSADAADARLFKLAESWRARLIEEGADAGFPGGASDELRALVDQARRERATGKPRGAARALFRHLLAALKAP